MCSTPQVPATIVEAQEKFELAMRNASAIDIVNNFGAAFNAAQVIGLLREALTDEVMNAVFMPLMNTKVGFRTDRDGKPDKNGRPKPLYDIPTVRDAIIDAAIIGLLPTGNQFNIISGTMYPTKEGYTVLLKKIGAKYIIDVQQDRSQNPAFAEFPCKITYAFNGEKNSLTVVATVRRDQYSSNDQLRGKAERRAKKALYEYLTGTDYGDADETSSRPNAVIDAVAVEISEHANAGGAIGIEPEEASYTEAATATSESAQPQTAPQAIQEQPQAATQPTPANNAPRKPNF
ncbi:hypothetical protein [Bacteroides congonensis]|jgi:hypothetical protein|uniref:hypothetical protein n=1 Tax=Bacteroides congonensis TaxID=1871006 RepID=UPI0025B7692F|nr:hypothetical protein [Bacteroides congonensis]